MFARFIGYLLLVPFGAWVLMISVGAVQSFWDFLPTLGYKQAFVFCVISAFFSSFVDADEIGVFRGVLWTLFTSWPHMLIMGALHSNWESIPALGYWQTVLMVVPFIGLMILVALGLALLAALSAAASRD